MNISDSSNPDLFRAYPDSRVDLWDENIVDGKYIIAYTLSSDLDDKLKNMLPMVRCQITYTIGLMAHKLGENFSRKCYDKLKKLRPWRKLRT